MVKAKEFLDSYKILKSKSLIEKPLVSVIMPTYCRGNNGLLERAIKSVLKQTFRELELIIVDDGSIDKTREVVKYFLENDDRIVYIRNEVNSGLPALRVNQGIMLARAEYISYQFDDDYWVVDALENMYSEIVKHKEDCLVYGKCQFNESVGGKQYILSHDFNYSDLIECNFIANNTVIHSINLVKRFGGYDCHLGMRRLCDWDLWIRWSSNVPFIHIDKVISIVEANRENSLGQTCVYDLNLFRVFQNYNRNEELKMDALNDYEIDYLEFIGNENLKKKIFNKHILPWYLNKRGIINENFPHEYSSDKDTILVTKEVFDSTIDITVTNFMKVLREKYNMIYIPSSQLNKEIIDFADIIIFYRTCSENSSNFLKLAMNKPNVYFIDDELLNFYKLSDDFNYLAPGTEMHKHLLYQIENSNLVVSYNKNISKSVMEHNDKVIELKTNILSRYLYKEINTNQNVFKIAFVGGSARKEELNYIWDDLLAVSSRYKEKVEFYFWGYIPDRINEIKDSNVFTQGYTSSYYEYLNRLYLENFDVILSPLFENEVKRCKSPIKYLESSVCNAVGLYSDVETYKDITDGYNGFKVRNEKGEWFRKIDQVFQMDREKRINIIKNIKNDILERFSTESQKKLFEAAMESVKIHNYLSKCGKMCYVIHSGYLGGAENHILRHALLAKQYKFNIVVCIPSYFQGMNEIVECYCRENGIEVCFMDFHNYVDTKSSEINKEQVEYESQNFVDLAKKHNIKLFHSTTLIPAVEIAARKLGVPHIASLYAVEKEKLVSGYEDVLPRYVHSDSVLFANVWAEGIDAVSKCIRSWIPETYFERTSVTNDNEVNLAVSGTLQFRKGQHKVIEAIGKLKEEGYKINLYLFGYNHFFPDYIKECQELINKYDIEEQVFLKGFCSDMPSQLCKMDALVCASDWESFPQAILESMAMGIPVISTPVTGVPELIKDNYTGYLSENFETESIKDTIFRFLLDKLNNKDNLQKITSKAKKVVYEECSKENVSNELFKFYNKAIKDLKNSKDELKLNQPNMEFSIVDNDNIQRKSEKIIHVPFYSGNIDLSKVNGQIIKDSKTYEITLANKMLKGLKIKIKDISKLGGVTVELSIKNKMDIVLRSASKGFAEIEDGEWMTFIFDKPLEGIEGKRMQVKLKLYDTNNKIKVYETNDGYLFGEGIYVI